MDMVGGGGSGGGGCVVHRALQCRRRDVQYSRVQHSRAGQGSLQLQSQYNPVHPGLAVLLSCIILYMYIHSTRILPNLRSIYYLHYTFITSEG